MKKVTANVKNRISRPLPVRLYNGFVGILHPNPGISADKLIKRARKQSGLHDFGDLLMEDVLIRLVDSINEEAMLNPFGVMITKIRLVNILNNLLRANHYFKKYPEILEAELDPVLVITGLQRTGTTMLHRLISSDPDTRAVHSWEALNPAPFPSMENEREKRLKLARQSEKGLQFLSKEFFAIHPVEHLAPEEEVLLLDTSFISTVAEATMNVPGFSTWVEKADHTPAYEQLKKMLLLLQWQDKRKRWILKTPHHMEFLPFLFKVFPDAKLVQTHRLPEETVASFLSMIYYGRKIFSDHVSTESVKAHWYPKVQRMVSESMKYRNQNPDKEFLDVQYRNLAKDPKAEVRRIYQYAGWHLREDLESLWDTTMQNNVKNKYGTHEYDLADYDLSIDKVRTHFEEYYDQYFSTNIKV